MKLINLVGTVLAGCGYVFGIDCSAKELAPYNLDSIKGIQAVTVLRDTPPTQTNFTWYVGLCETINDDVDQCPKNSDICGITLVNLNQDSRDKTVVTEIVGFNSNLQKTYKSHGDKGFTIEYKAMNWGSNLVNASIHFKCADKVKDDTEKDKLTLILWDDSALKLSMKTKAACFTNKGDKKKPGNGHDKDGHDERDESWGWFTWIFIFLVLFLSIYIVGGAWFQYSKGNAIDFQSALKEVLENFFDLLRGLPHFIREIIEKVTGNSNRGEYSAV